MFKSRYSESRWCNQQARKLYRELDGKVKGLRQLPSEPTKRLKQLKEWLTELSQTAFDYANHLRDLELHRSSIKTNHENYQFWLNQIEAISLKREDNLELWQQFMTRKSEKFIKQINTDLSYLLPSQQLFQQMIDTIRGIVETEQAERDRSLENTIQIIGVGLGAGAIISGVVTQHIEKRFAPISLNNPPHPLVLSLFWSVLATLFFGTLAWLWTKRK